MIQWKIVRELNDTALEAELEQLEKEHDVSIKGFLNSPDGMLIVLCRLTKRVTIPQPFAHTHNDAIGDTSLRNQYCEICEQSPCACKETNIVRSKLKKVLEEDVY